jgi:hypothetical protein
MRSISRCFQRYGSDAFYYTINGVTDERSKARTVGARTFDQSTVSSIETGRTREVGPARHPFSARSTSSISSMNDTSCIQDEIHAILGLLASVRSNIMGRLSHTIRSKPCLGVLHRIIFKIESIVSSLVELSHGMCDVKQGFIESKYSSGAIDAQCGEPSRPCQLGDQASAMGTFLTDIRDAVENVSETLAVFERQGVVENYLSVEDNLKLLKAATNDLRYSMAAFEPLVAEGMPLDVVEDYMMLMNRLADVEFYADVDVVGAVQGVLIESVLNVVGERRENSVARGALDAMVGELMVLGSEYDTADKSAWLAREVEMLIDASLRHKVGAEYSLFLFFICVAHGLAERVDFDALTKAQLETFRLKLDQICDDICAMRSYFSGLSLDTAVERAEGADPQGRTGALLLVAITVYDSCMCDSGMKRGGEVHQNGHVFETLSTCLDMASSPLTRSMLLLSIREMLLLDGVLKDPLSLQQSNGLMMSLVRFVDSLSPNVRRHCASALAAFFSKSPPEIRLTCHRMGISKRLILQLSVKQHDVLGHGASLAALGSMVTNQVAVDLTGRAGEDPFQVMVPLINMYLDMPIKGSEQVVRHATRLVYLLISKNAVGSYKALLSGAVPSMLRILGDHQHDGATRNFALLSLYQLSKVTSSPKEDCGWSTTGITSLLDALADSSSKAARSAALLTLKHVLRNHPELATVEVTNAHLRSLVQLLSHENDGVRSGAAAVIEQVLSRATGNRSPRMASCFARLGAEDVLKRMSTDGENDYEKTAADGALRILATM